MSYRKHGLILLSILAITPVLIFLIQPGSALAFFPTNWRTLAGLLGTSHEQMTDTAIEAFDQTFYSLPVDFFGNPVLTTSMKTARDAIADANEQVDLNDASYVIAANHFDAEQFSQGQTRLVSLRSQIVQDLIANDGASARTHLGQALHTLQDFYAHSNWVEDGNTAINPSLGVPGASVGTVTAASVATCQPCTVAIIDGEPSIDCLLNLLVSSLTTGYYGGEPGATKPVLASGMKCNHGGPFDSLGYEGINKDSDSSTFSPHYTSHQSAATLAAAATTQFINFIYTDVGGSSGRSMMNLLLGGGPTLVFVIDTTGSMSDIQGQVLEQAVQSIQDLVASGTPPSKYVLSPFNDPTTGPTIVTTDPNVFISAVQSLGASGGGDCPELSLTGILSGIAAADDGAQLFMFSDANAKDTVLTQNVISAAAKKHVQINPMNFLDTCSTGSDPVYSAIAQQSGGQFFFLQRDEAATIASYVDFVVSNNLVNVLNIASHLSTETYTVPVDSTMSRVSFAISGPTGSITSSGVTLIRPDGTTVKSTDGGVSVLQLSTGVIWSINSPAAGAWTITLTGSGNFSLNVTANSSLTLSRFRFVAPGGRVGHQGYFPIPGSPVAGQVVNIDAVVEGAQSQPQFQLVGLNGSVIQSISLTGGGTLPPGEFVGTAILPTTPFVAYITGTDNNGKAYQRAVAGSSTAQTVTITPPSPQSLAPGSTTSYAFQIQNLGSPDTFTILATDDQKFLTGLTPGGAPSVAIGGAVLGYSATVTLATNQTAVVTAQLTPGSRVPNGTLDNLNITVTGSTSGATNYATLNNSVTALGEPALAGATAGQGAASPGQYYVNLKLTNTGKGTAGSTTITQVSTRTLAGTGAVAYSSPTLPDVVGDIGIGASATTQLLFTVPSTVTRFSFTVSGTTYDPFGTPLQFSLSQTVLP